MLELRRWKMTPETGLGSAGKVEEAEEELDESSAAAADGGAEEAPTHLPFATSPEFCGISTTVDPSYIISLIRKLLPCNTKMDSYSKSIHKNTTCAEESEVSAGKACSGGVPISTWRDEMILKIEQLGKSGQTDKISEQSELLSVEDVWEDSGCILWDLAANRDHAKFMVENFLLDVLSLNLTVSSSPRVTEICLGIIGNLACHDVLRNSIISSSGLVETIIEQLILEDTAGLCEMCRLLTVSLHGEASAPWVEALSPEYIIQRILWIAENTLNSQLLEKVMELLLAIITHEDIAKVLLPSLMKLGLSDLLVGLLSCEMIKQIEACKLERPSVVDLILQVTEALSTTDFYSWQISSNVELLNLLSGIVKLPDKDEVGSCCETSVVIIANILLDEPHLALELSKDIPFLQGLLDTFPFVTGDPQARNAIWSILARLFLQIQESDISTSSLQQYVRVLLGKAYLIEDDLKGHASDDSGECLQGTAVSDAKANAATISLRRIASILNQWIVKRAAREESDQNESGIDDKKVQMLLGYCCKYGDCV